MSDFEEKNTENEFLNILEEPETSSPNELILGARDGEICGGIDSCLDLVCPSECHSDYCADCPSHNLTCPSNSVCVDSSGKYHYLAFTHLYSNGYYKSDSYPISGARGTFQNAVSSDTLAGSAILYTLKNSLTNSVTLSTENYRKYLLTSGLVSSDIYPTGTTPARLVGYVYLSFFSAATHYPLQTLPVPIYGITIRNQNSFNSYYNIISGNPGWGSHVAYLPEKTFYLNVVYSGSSTVGDNNLQGAEITLNNASYQAFPQLLLPNGTYQKLKTGVDGSVVLCTSSLTSNTINGFVKRRGFGNNMQQIFAAQAQEVTVLPLSSRMPSAECETITVEKANSEINPNFNYGNMNMNLTSTLLSRSGYTSRGLVTSSTDQVLTFDKVFQIRPGLQYLCNDPLLGKMSSLTYSVPNNLNLNGSFQTAATLTLNTKYIYEIIMPTIINNGTDGVTFDISYSTVIQGISYNDILKIAVLGAGQTFGGEEAVISYASIIHSSGGPVTNPEVDYTLYLRGRISAGANATLYAGSYSYTYTEVNGNTGGYTD